MQPGNNQNNTHYMGGYSNQLEGMYKPLDNTQISSSENGMNSMYQGGVHNPNMYNQQAFGNYQMVNPMMGNMFQPFGYIPPAGPQNYKTKKCRHFETGRCKLAGLCNFAHGDEDLRNSSEK